MANYISPSGQIVGNSFPCVGGPSHAFLWKNGSIISLNAFVPPGSDLTLSDATFISGRGEIAVNATLSNGDTHAVLLMPVGKGVNPSATASLRNEPVPADAQVVWIGLRLVLANFCRDCVPDGVASISGSGCGWRNRN